MHHMSRILYLATISTLAALLLGLLAASPALAQQGANTQNPQQTPVEPEEVTLTGVIQSEETRFVLDRFFLIDEQSGVDRTLASLGPDEGGVVLSELVGERVRLTGIPQTLGNPRSNFESFNKVPVLITSLEIIGEDSARDQYADESTGDQYAEDPPAEDPPAVDGNTGDDPVAEDGQEVSDTVDELPDTGGLELPILVGGMTLVLGGLVLRKRMS